MTKKLKTWELGRISAEEFEKADKIPVVIVLDNIRSGHNVGSVFRTADAFRIQEIRLCGHSCMPPHPEIYKTALGAEDTIPYIKFESVVSCLEDLKTQNYRLIGIEQTDTSMPLQTFPVNPAHKYAIVLGNEVNGVQLEALNLCHHILEIPQEGTKHSLNISVAAGIVLWEFFKHLR
jgi:23S rRNA (guanosine2251-2'-O)-methyltransferase